MSRRTLSSNASSSSEQEVWDPLADFFQARMGSLRQIFNEIGASAQDLWVLSYLSDFGPTSAGEVSDFMGVTPAAVSFVIHGLEANGRVEFRPARHDRRRVIIRLRPAGRTTFRRVVRWRVEFGHELPREFSPRERAEFVRAMHRISSGMNAPLSRSMPPAPGARSNSRRRVLARARVHRHPGS